jgi:hypothetical protein
MMTNSANQLQAREVTVRHVLHFTNSGVINDTVVSFYVGEHGPFTLKYEKSDPPATQIRSDIGKKISELRQLAEPIV